MSLPRFFYDGPLTTDSTLKLPPAIANHAGRSLRLRDGDRIVLFNGQGGEHEALLSFIDGQAHATLQQFNPNDRLPKGRITLAQALASGDKMDWIVEKNSEVGITAIQPLKADRSILQLSGPRLTKRLERWQAIANSSAEQCGRNVPLAVQNLSTVDEALTNATDYDLILVCHHEDGKNLSHLLQSLKSAEPEQTLSNICLLIGPEGGWSDRELEVFEQYKQKTDHLHTVIWGERVFRTETAAIALASVCMALLDWN